MKLHFPSVIQFIKFGLVGVSGMVVDVGVYWFLTRVSIWGFHNFLLVSILASGLANLNNFYWHRRFTFTIQAGDFWAHYLKFLGASIIYLGALQITFWWLVHFGKWPDVLAKLIALLVWAILYYKVLKSWIFKQPVQPGGLF